MITSSLLFVFFSFVRLLISLFVCFLRQCAAAEVWQAREASTPFVLNLDSEGFKWQGHVARFLLGTQADDRHVIWVHEAEGNRGKSKLPDCTMMTSCN